MKLTLAALCISIGLLVPAISPLRPQDTKPKTITIQFGATGPIQATWSQTETSDSVSTHFLLVSMNKGKLLEVSQEGSLWTTSGAFPLDDNGDIGFLIVSQVGAKVMDAKLVGIFADEEARQIAEWNGFEIEPSRIANGNYLIKVRELEAPHGISKFYTWDGKSMADVSSKHPDLYRVEIENIENTIKGTNNYPAYYYAEECRDLALALSYSHNDKEAAQWCEKVQMRLANERYMPTDDAAEFKIQVDQTLAQIRKRITDRRENPAN